MRTCATAGFAMLGALWLTVFASGFALPSWSTGSAKPQAGDQAQKAQVKMSPFDRESLVNRLKESQGRPLVDTRSTDKYIANFQTESSRYAVLNVEFKNAVACKAFAAPAGAHIAYRFDRFADIFVHSAEALLALENNADVRWIDLALNVYLPPPSLVALSKEKSRSVETLIHGGIEVPQTGKGVILVVVDSGIDFHHPDFVTLVDGQPQSRLLYFWDTVAEQTDKANAKTLPPVRFPNGDPIGTVYTQAQLNAALKGQGYVPIWDTHGHGTACASIAAGNGRAAPANLKKEHVGVGVAPEADLLAVRIGSSGRGLEHFFLLGAICEWVDKIARERKQPYVISCSFGGDLGSHDGNLVAERQLDAHFPVDAPGRAICIAAGNDGDLDRHAEIKFAGKEAPGKLTWKCDTPNTHMVVYYDNATADDLVFDKKDVGKIQTYVHPLTGGVVTEVKIQSQDPWSPGVLSIWSKSGKTIKADAYLEKGDAYFTGPCVKYGKQISTPASTKNAIAVGSYDWNSVFHRYGKFLDYHVDKGRNFQSNLQPLLAGGLSAYSNPGPSRSGEVRPDIVAPGQWHYAAAASNIDAVEAFRDTSARYRLFNGTSAACPYTAGVVALMMQTNPKINLNQIRQLFRTKATSDNLTGPVPNPGWGNGRLDSKAIQEMLKEIR